MKKLLVLICLLWTTQAMSQSLHAKMAADSSYATSDTTAWFNIDWYSYFKIALYFKDSANVALRVDYRGAGAPEAIFQTDTLVADSTFQANGLFLSYDLRGEGGDNIPGATHIRLIVTRAVTKNGVTSPTYDCYLYRY